jgi:hypothetical protein
LTTRSSTRSISSKPRRNGLESEGTRDIVYKVLSKRL